MPRWTHEPCMPVRRRFVSIALGHVPVSDVSFDDAHELFFLTFFNYHFCYSLSGRPPTSGIVRAFNYNWDAMMHRIAGLIGLNNPTEI
ncbi:hypothetical protein ACHAPT_005733 [Fusarium lateritium]